MATCILRHIIITLIIIDYTHYSPPIEEHFITYTCPPGFVMTGPSTSVCMGNGEWEPDPGKVECIGDNLLLVHYIMEFILI